MSAPLLAVRGLTRTFVTGAQRVPAVQDVSFDLGAGETLALVGESGSGKSTTARLVLRLLTPDAGSIRFDGVDWLALPPRELNRRRRAVGVVFQDPATSLDPRMTVEEIVAEPLVIHGIGTRAERRARVARLLAEVGLPDSARERVPREFSGGQRQRVGIARALATEPKLVVLDEPVSALDVSVRAQVLNLLSDLQEQTPSRPAFLFIGHDLSLVRQFADRVAVMYLGRIVEEGPAEALFTAPRHPYTALLLESRPRSEPGPPRAMPAAGEPASAARLPEGCAFHPRCPKADDLCRTVGPLPAADTEAPGRTVACHHPL